MKIKYQTKQIYYYCRIEYVNSRKFCCKIKTANLATKVYIAGFGEETEFDNKLKNLKTLLQIKQNKTKQLLEIELEELSKKVELISTTGLTEDLIIKCKILNGAKYFYSDILKNYLVFISTNKYVEFLSNIPNIFFHGSIKEFQKSVIKLLQDLTVLLLQF